jgi:predicted nucleic acid-binding protein
MTGFVVDASIALAWCFADEATEQTDALLDEAAVLGALAPTIWSYEMANILGQAVASRRITGPEVSARLAEAVALVEVTGAVDSLVALCGAVTAHGLTAYDAAYLLLAQATGLRLATLDRALRAAAVAAGVPVVGET